MTREINATLLGMTVRQYSAYIANRSKIRGMFAGLKVTPQHIVNEINNSWMVQKKASEMDELGLTNEELVVIIKKLRKSGASLTKEFSKL